MKNRNLIATVMLFVALTSCGNNTSEKESVSYSEKKANVSPVIEEEETAAVTDTEEIPSESVEEVLGEVEEVVNLAKNQNDFDAYIKSYEEFVDQYIKLMKKVKKGDMTVMAEYAEYMEKSNDLSNEIQNVKSQISTVQMSKLLKVQSKLMEATAQMYK